MTLQELQDSKDTLQKAIFAGVLEVRFNERWIKYQHLTDMRQALADLNTQIANVSNGNAPQSMCNLAEFNG